MTVLGIDIGNTHSEVGLFKNDLLIDSIRLTSSVQKTEDEFWFYMERFLEKHHILIDEIQDLVISSVVPGLNFIFSKLGYKYLGKEPFFISSEVQLGLNINYTIPEQIGADRLCSAVAAYNKYKTDLIVIDFGTATTFDIIYAEGSYEGGIIASGLETTNWGLHQRAAKLPRVKLDFPDKIIGKNTENAIQAGLMYGEVAMIDGLIARIIDEEKRNFTILTTGGLAAKISPKLSHKVIVEPTLLMEGLYGIYRKNR